MYHIKEDRRSRASAEAIVKGLQTCLSSMPLKTVTVTDIHRASGVSRATFYRLFDTPDDVLHYQFDRMVENADKSNNPMEHLEKTIAQGMRYHEFIKALVDNRRIDLLFEYTEKSFRTLDLQGVILPEDMDKTEREYILTHLSMSMVATLITWARNGRKESATEVAGYMRKYVDILNTLMIAENPADPV